MTISMLGIGIDCADAARLAQFWGDVLGRDVNPDPSMQSASLAPADVDQSGPLLMFHQVPEAKAVKNRLHFDLATSQVDVETDRLLGLGATRLRTLAENGGGWVSLADPEGNEFDLVAR
jgi:predicted enzyme related to lactoylglutathione lyase